MKLYGVGINEVSVGGQRYTAGPDGVFDVPDAHARVLIESHGLKGVPVKVEAPAPAEAGGRKKGR